WCYWRGLMDNQAHLIGVRLRASPDDTEVPEPYVTEVKPPPAWVKEEDAGRGCAQPPWKKARDEAAAKMEKAATPDPQTERAQTLKEEEREMFAKMRGR